MTKRRGLLHMLAGTWRTEGQLVGTPPGSKTTLAAVDRYEWVPGLDLLAHYVAGHLGRKSVASFEIWAYDRRRRSCASTSFDENGVPATTFSGTWDQKSGRSWRPWLTIVLHRLARDMIAAAFTGDPGARMAVAKRALDSPLRQAEPPPITYDAPLFATSSRNAPRRRLNCAASSQNAA